MPITIDKPESYFNTVLWTGNNSSPRDIATGHATDFVWVKFRANPYNHRLFDNVRGGGKKLISNNTDAEDTGATGDVSGFISTGFTIGSNINNSADGTLVGWSWKANGSGVSNTAGTITSTVSANTTSGFSIVSYTGNGSNSTVGHGLGVAPKFIIFKNRSSATGWACYNVNIGASKYLALNETIEAQTATGVSNSTDPTSSVFSIGTADRVNTNGNTYIAYCFAEVKGFSKAFSYTGNGSADGTYVHLGFRPAWVMVKASSTGGAGYNWQVWDNKRNTYNAVNTQLRPNTSEVDNTDSSYAVDFLSNGFKMRGTSSNQNGSGVTYIGFAIAEQPFVSSKGIVANAR